MIRNQDRSEQRGFERTRQAPEQRKSEKKVRQHESQTHGAKRQRIETRQIVKREVEHASQRPEGRGCDAETRPNDVRQRVFPVFVRVEQVAGVVPGEIGVQPAG